MGARISFGTRSSPENLPPYAAQQNGSYKATSSADPLSPKNRGGQPPHDLWRTRVRYDEYGYTVPPPTEEHGRYDTHHQGNNWYRKWCWLIAALAVLDGVLCLFFWYRQNKEEPKWVQELVGQIGDEHSVERGVRGTPYRAVVETVFEGTHVAGYPPGKAGGDNFIANHDGEKVDGEFGPVVLSADANILRNALQAHGFIHQIRYHGTENVFIPSILTGGFLISDGWHGKGVYTTRTFAHAQCYSEGEGGPVLEVEVYTKLGPDASKYTAHVPHNSEADDVFLVKDPLLVLPKVVLKCCPEELTCVR